MIRAAASFFVLAFAAIFFAITLLFWCAVGTAPGMIVLLKLGLPLTASAVVSALFCGLPLAVYASKRWYAGGAETPPPETAPEAPIEATKVTTPEPSAALHHTVQGTPVAPERFFYTRLIELQEEEAALEARLSVARKRRNEFEQALEDPDTERLLALYGDHA